MNLKQNLKSRVIAIELSGKWLDNSIEIWEFSKNKLNAKYIANRSPVPHINLISEIPESQNNILNLFNQLELNINSFTLSSLGLGVFYKDSIVFHLDGILQKRS